MKFHEEEACSVSWYLWNERCIGAPSHDAPRAFLACESVCAGVSVWFGRAVWSVEARTGVGRPMVLLGDGVLLVSLWVRVVGFVRAVSEALCACKDLSARGMRVCVCAYVRVDVLL